MLIGESERITEEEVVVRHIYNMKFLEYNESFVFESAHPSDWHLFCVYRDEVETLLNGEWVPLLAGHMVLIPPKTTYGLKIGVKSHPKILMISLNCEGSRVSELANIRLHLSADGFASLNDVLSDAKFAFNISSDMYDQAFINKSLSSKTRQILKNKLELLLLDLLETNEQHSETMFLQPPAAMLSRQMLINSINEYLNTHISGAVTLTDMSNALNFSASYLNSVYRKATGHSIITAFNKMKIDHAKIYMEKSDYGITRISELLGFSSVHYFSRAFKKIAGLTPSEYLAQVRNKKEGFR